MALIKEKTLLTGEVGEYWRITNMALERGSNRIEYTIELCKDEAHRLYPMACKKKYVTTIDSVASAGNLLTYGYTFIKAQASTDIVLTPGGPTTKYDPDLDGATDS